MVVSSLDCHIRLPDQACWPQPHQQGPQVSEHTASCHCNLQCCVGKSDPISLCVQALQGISDWTSHHSTVDCNDSMLCAWMLVALLVRLWPACSARQAGVAVKRAYCHTYINHTLYLDNNSRDIIQRDLKAPDYVNSTVVCRYNALVFLFIYQRCIISPEQEDKRIVSRDNSAIRCLQVTTCGQYMELYVLFQEPCTGHECSHKAGQNSQ